ncbi:glycosyltransferase [bacterium C-53]|nr:glycosyltransferase [Lachnospiraceae bacterium]NBI02636.1 glycosyltransferase [Lachnospiraceae bacterium]RKJ11275.1 glycosyltransferase [bacterium C-53]
MIKVSVVMPVYNAEKYLEQTLDCLVNQTMKEMEIICVDDGSTDQSCNILKKYAQIDSRITIYYQKNSGAGIARNLGIQHATGEYLSILDSDDVFELDMLESAYRKAKIDEVDICVFKMDMFAEEVEKRYPWHLSILKSQLPDFEPFTYKDISENIFRVFVGWTWDKLFRRQFVIENKLFFQDLRTTNDMFFTYTALVRASKICILNKTLVHQRINLKNSLSATREKSWNCFYIALLSLREELKKIGIYKQVERSYINYALHFSIWHLDTLTMPAFQTLYDKLKNEYFSELGISSKNKEYFWDKGEYQKYKQIKMMSFEEYREVSGMDARNEKHPFSLRKISKCNSPKISILIPIYNAEPFLTECLNSIVNQTISDIEIICINYESTDRSLDIVKTFAKDDERIILVDGLRNEYGKSMNQGLNIATGAFIGIVNSSDYIKLNMYELLYNAAQKEKLDFIVCDFNQFVYKEKNKEYAFDRKILVNCNLYGRVISPEKTPIIFKYVKNVWGGIYKRSFLVENCIRYNEMPGKYWRDEGFLFQVLCYAERVSFFNQPLYQHREESPVPFLYEKASVYWVCEEYQYIYRFLLNSPIFEERFINYYNLRKYYSYMMNFNQIADERKLEFVNRFYEEFKLSYEKNELKEEVFDDMDWDWVVELLTNPMDFYAHYYADSYKKKVPQLKQQIDWMQASRAWKLGRAMAYLPNKILKR